MIQMIFTSAGVTNLRSWRISETGFDTCGGPHLRLSPGPEHSLDWSQGPPLPHVKELVDGWRKYDWRLVKSELNPHGQALTEIDGLSIHFLHVRSARADARPLVLTHGWPSPVIEPLEVMDALANPLQGDMPAFPRSLNSGGQHRTRTVMANFCFWQVSGSILSGPSRDDCRHLRLALALIT
jgi:hypothetical protein